MPNRLFYRSLIEATCFSLLSLFKLKFLINTTKLELLHSIQDQIDVQSKAMGQQKITGLCNRLFHPDLVSSHSYQLSVCRTLHVEENADNLREEIISWFKQLNSPEIVFDSTQEQFAVSTHQIDHFENRSLYTIEHGHVSQVGYLCKKLFLI